AAPAPAAKPAAAAAAADGFYTVKQGDTLYSIALDNGADYREVAQWNGLDDPTKLRIGQVLRVKPAEAVPGARPGVVVSAARGSGRVESRPVDAAPAAGAVAAARIEPTPRAAPAAEGEGVDF